MISRDAADFSTTKEGSTSDNKTAASKPAPSSSTSWSRLKDPRIVRVSRALGGKDRHSKVCTVRGLRDRRVRLSVPTAIQLYDLQDRLGLNQPSKVVDWLLNAAKHEIDELPPLQMPPGNFPQNFHPMLTSHHHGLGASSQSHDKGLKTSSSINWDDPSEQPRLDMMDSDATLRANSKEVIGDGISGHHKDQIWTRNEGKDCNLEGGHHGGYASSSNNFLQRPNHSSSLAGLMSNSMSYNSFLRWDPSNLSLSHGGSHGLPPQPEEFRNFNIVPLPSGLNMASGSQVVVYPPGVAQSYFPSNVVTATEFDAKHINLQMFSSSSQNPLSNSLTQHADHSSSQSVRPFQFSMMANRLPSHNNGESEPNKDNDHFDSR